MTELDIKRMYNDVLLERIPRGEQSAISIELLSSRLGLSNKRTHRMIQAANIDKVIICETDDGIYLPESDQELSYYVMKRIGVLVYEIEVFNAAYEKVTGNRLVLTCEGGENG